MNLLTLFADKARLDLALELAALPQDTATRANLLAKAGLGTPAEAEVLHAARIFARLRADNARPKGHVCLDENCLAEFVDGVLPEAERPDVERALADCPVCLKSALALAQLTQELVPATPWTEVVLGMARKGLRLLTAPLEGFAEMDLQPVAVLSGVATEPATRRWRLVNNGIIGTFTVSLEEGESAALSVSFERAGKPVTHGRICLRLDDALLEVHPLAHGESHTFWHLEPGHYALEFTAENGEGARFPITLESVA